MNETEDKIIKRISQAKQDGVRFMGWNCLKNCDHFCYKTNDYNGLFCKRFNNPLTIFLSPLKPERATPCVIKYGFGIHGGNT